MTRPLRQDGVAQLEQLFAKSRCDAKVLKQLEHELQYRQVPRAVALLAEVQAVMYGVATATHAVQVHAPVPPPKLPVLQPELWERALVFPIEPPQSAAQSAQHTAPVAPPLKPATPNPHTGMAPSNNVAPPTPPAVSIDDAYKVLKTTPSSTWASIELTRRQLVQQAHPSLLAYMSPANRDRANEEARLVNAAYATLSRHRIETS